MPVQERRNNAAALKLLRKLLRNQGVRPETIVTDTGAESRCVPGSKRVSSATLN